MEPRGKCAKVAGKKNDKKSRQTQRQQKMPERVPGSRTIVMKGRKSLLVTVRKENEAARKGRFRDSSGVGEGNKVPKGRRKTPLQ